MIPKNQRVYIDEWLKKDEKAKEGDTLIFNMPPFCSGEYSAEVYVDSEGDAYINKEDSYYDGCRSLFLRKNN